MSEVKLSKDETLNLRIAQELIKKRVLKGKKHDADDTTVTPEDIEKYFKISNQLNTQELSDLF